MKRFLLLITACCCYASANALVDFSGTFVLPRLYGPACLEQFYVEVGFGTNLEINNATFQVERSLDPGFSSATLSTPQLNGCGTCGPRQYSVNDYGPFQSGEVWYYRVKAVSNALNSSYEYLGTFTVSIPATINWVKQVTSSYVTGSTPDVETAYAWNAESRTSQGVTISLIPTEINKIYLEENNNKVNFELTPVASFINLDINVDNAGYYNLHNGTPVSNFIWSNSINAFSGIGLHNLKVKYTTPDGIVYLREYNVFLVPKSDALYMDNYCNTMRVWKGADPLEGTPLILSEGFDAYNIKAEQYYRESGKDLINCLLLKGFNIYVMNYNLNAQSIKNNAAVLQAAIRYISVINGNKPVVATGMSMGGIINRLACAKAEQEGNPLPISKFVTLDSPHQGAYISDSLQAYVKRKNLEVNDNYSAYASNNDAAKELLRNNRYDTGSPIHNNFYSYLNTVNGDGYPHLVEKIAVSFSNNQPNPSTIGTEWLEINITTPFEPDKHFYIEQTESEAGSYLPLLNKDNIVSGSGKFWPWNMFFVTYPFLFTNVAFDQYAYPAFIPHTSSLDLINNISPFDVVITPQLTQFHDVVPPDIIEPLVNALVAKNVFVQNITYAGAKNIIASETIFAGNQVNANEPFGDVNLLSGSAVRFKAGQEIELQSGINIDPGAEFEAVIEPVVCDGVAEVQHRNLLADETYDVSGSHTNAASENLHQPVVAAAALSKIEIRPNPASGFITLLNAPAGQLCFSIRSVTGSSLANGVVSNEQQLDVSFLAPGLYVLELTDEKRQPLGRVKFIRQ